MFTWFNAHNRTETVAYQIQTSLLSLLYFMLKVFTFFSLLAQLTFLKQPCEKNSSYFNFLISETAIDCQLLQGVRCKNNVKLYDFSMWTTHGFGLHIDMGHKSDEVLQSLASFNYSKCSLHAGAA